MDEDTISAWNDSINFLLVFVRGQPTYPPTVSDFVHRPVCFLRFSPHSSSRGTRRFWHIFFANSRFSSKQLERDPSETAAELLVVLVSHFNGSSIPSRSELSLDRFAAPASARITNAFWFLSLSLALVVSMMAILAKQWITMFSSRMRAPAASFRWWAHRHRVFRDGIDRWHINAFVSSLSVALHGAVIMFMAGLIVHLFARDLIIFGLVLGITVLVVVFYIWTTVAPLYDGTCPTATPLLIHGHQVYLTVLRAIGCLPAAPSQDPEAGNPAPDTEAGNHPPHDKPPFDPDVVLADGNGDWRDVRILTLMITDLPSGSDVDAAFDALGALKPGTRDLGEDLERVRHQARRRINQCGSAVGIATTDLTAVARALRSSILIESCCKHADWVNIGTLVTSLRLIRTHVIFVLSTALLLLVRTRHLKRLSDLGRLEWRISYRQRGERWIEDSISIAAATTKAIARWKLQVPPAPYAWQPFLPHIHACFLDSIGHLIASSYNHEQVDLALCAALVISFGGEPNVREKYNKLVTPLAISALDRELGQRVGVLGRSPWQQLPDSEDWRLRAVCVWAQVTSKLPNLEPSASLAGEVYSYILTRWTDEDWGSIRLTPAVLREIVISSKQLNLPAAGRATLWNISKHVLAKTPVSSLHHDVIRYVLHGVSPDEMIAAHPTIVDSIVRFVREQFGGHHITYERYYGACNQLMAFVEPDISATSSRPGSIWQILHPYLVTSPDDEGLASLAADASVVLLIHALMGGDSPPIFEQLLGGKIGRRVVLSQKHRITAFRFATHARLFAQTWWASMRKELLEMDGTIGTWIVTEGYEHAATFVRKVEEEEICSYCMQKCFAWQSWFEEDRYNDAWIQYGEGAHELMVVS